MNVADQQLPNLTGKTRLEARIVLSNHSFQFKSYTAGGYETYDHPDGSAIHLRPNGEIVRTGPKIRGNNGKYYRRRYDQFGN